MMINNNKSKGNVIPFVLMFVIFISFFLYLASAMSSDPTIIRNVNEAQFDTSSPLANTTILNTECGGDVICNFNNINTLMSYESDYTIFTILILLPTTIIFGLILLFWIRGVGL